MPVKKTVFNKDIPMRYGEYVDYLTESICISKKTIERFVNESIKEGFFIFEKKEGNFIFYFINRELIFEELEKDEIFKKDYEIIYRNYKIMLE